MTENELAKIIVDCAYHIHVKLGPGLLESVYEVVLINFGLTRIKDGIERVANGLNE